MKRVFTACAIGFICVMAGLSFGDGKIVVGIIDLILAATNLPFLLQD